MSTPKQMQIPIFRAFPHGSKEHTTSSSSSHGSSYHSHDESSEDDKSADMESYGPVAGPACFMRSPPKDGVHLQDDDYEKYLRQPKYIKTLKKSGHTLPISKQLFLAQELSHCGTTVAPNAEGLDGIDDIHLDDEPELETCNTKQNMKDRNAIWAMRFSLDGKFLASAGKSGDVKIWKVIASPLDRLESNGTNKQERSEYASVFQEQPYRTFTGHTDDILSLDWSKNNFLLSSSMDKTVRLWNMKQERCLRTFTHADFIPSIKFHPTDDRFFISGCLDHKVRLWSILENEVSYEFDAKDLVTAVAFTPNGNITVVGTFKGMVFFLDTQNLELRHSIDLNKKKSSSLNMKITGIESFVDGDDIKVMISSNDSKIRLISLRHKQLEFYFKGLSNNSSQIIATVSEDHKYIISGSENHWVYLWAVHKDSENNASHLKSLVTNKKKRKDYTTFHAHHSLVTCAAIAPSGTFKALSLSNDYIYELSSELSQIDNDTSLSPESKIGGIIVTSDDQGLIRVFRQDFSKSVRKSLLNEKKKRDALSTSSNGLTKHLNMSANSLLSRSNSTKTAVTGAEKGKTSPRIGRPRSDTTESISQRLNLNVNPTPTPCAASVLCEVCNSNKFTVTKGTQGCVEVFCTDCGNQIK